MAITEMKLPGEEDERAAARVGASELRWRARRKRVALGAVRRLWEMNEYWALRCGSVGWALCARSVLREASSEGLWRRGRGWYAKL